MPQPPDWKRVLETGMQFTEMRRSHAHRIATDLVAQGQLARDQIGAAVDELVEMSRRRSEELRSIVSAEVQRQLSVIGLATKRDLDALERRLRGQVPATTRTRKGGGTKRPATKKTAQRAPATKKPARKATTKSAATPRKAAAKKTVRKDATRRTGTKAVRRPGARRAR
jgi:polyhydroxyalkanoate synthesis regulator phasin